MSGASLTEIFSTACFALAIVHTFSVKRFLHFASKQKSGSAAENLFHLLGEVEVVFGIWAAVFLFLLGINEGPAASIKYLETRDFTEPAFVFVIMSVCATRPIFKMASTLIHAVSKIVPFEPAIAFYFTCVTIGPLLGSFITEPAAMTVTALILLEQFYKRGISCKFMYATLGLLFVNVSIGGTLTPYSAPPVLMVAEKWNWDLKFMLLNFGWKAAIAVIAATSIVTLRFKDELKSISEKRVEPTEPSIPIWVFASHLIFLAAIIICAHYLAVFAGIFLFFLGLTAVTKEHQNVVSLREGLLVAFFLGGVVILGGLQRWWLEPILTELSTLPLFLGSMSLTAFTDNAALTYLGSQVPNLDSASKYSLVAGSVVGGGLTVIANAPNLTGYGILNSSFGEEGISPLLLFTNALLPTAVAGICFWFF